MSIPFKLLAPQDVLEAFYANVQRSTTIYMVMLDTEGKILNINRAFATNFGKTPDELLGTSWFDVAVPVPERDNVRQVFRRVLDTGLPDVYQSPVVFPDGRQRMLLWSNTLTHSGDKLTGTLSFGIDVTEQVESTQALKHREHQLRRSEEIAHLGTYILDIKTGTWSSSTELDTIFGIGPEDPRSVESWVALVHPDERDMMSKYFLEEVIGHRAHFDREYRIVRASDAEVRWVHGYGDLETGPDGTLSLMIGAIQDITDTRARATEFKQVSDEYRTLFQFAPLGIARVGLNKVLLEANTTFANMLGYTPGEMVGKTIQDITFRDDWEIGMPELKRIVAGELGVTMVEKRYLRKDGGIMWGRTVISLIRGPDTAPLFFLPFIHDVTAELEAKTLALAAAEALHKSEERYRVASRNTGQLVYDWEITSDRLYWEGAILDLTGYTPDEFPGNNIKGWAELIHPNDRAQALALLDTAKARREKYFVTYRFRRKDGFYITIEDHGLFLADEAGVTSRMVGAMRDVTSMRTSEDDMREFLEKLPIAIWIQRDGRYLYVNPAGIQLIGAKNLNEIVGTSIFDRVAPEDLSLAKQRQEHFKATREVAGHSLLKMRKMDGTLFDSRVDAVTINYQGGLATLSAVRSIDSVSVQELREVQQQQELADVLATMSQGFAEHTMLFDDNGTPVDYRFLSVNAAFEQLTGLEAENIIGKTVKTVLPGVEDVWIERYGEVVKTGQPASFVQKSSAIGSKTFSVKAWRTGPNKFANIFTDITNESKEQQRIFNILNRSIDIFTIVNTDGICTFQSERIRTLAGYEPSDMVGKSVFTFIHPDDLAHTQKEFTHALQDPTYHELVRFRFHRKDGAWMWLESVGTEWLEAEERGLLISSRDVTGLQLKSKESERAKELQTMNSALIGRELRIVELKEQVKTLTAELEKHTAS